jgi:excisionase family DNA binding protein
VTAVSVQGNQVFITVGRHSQPSLVLSIEDWRGLKSTVEAAIEAAYVTYDDAAARLGVHRSTLGDWIAQGKLERVLIDGRGYVAAANVSALAQSRVSSHSGLLALDGSGLSATPKPGSTKHENTRTMPAQVIGRKNLAQSDRAPHASPESISSAASMLVRELTSGDTIKPVEFPGGRIEAQQPGVYAWWGDETARSVLGDVLGIRLPALLYVGQAGATSRSGKESGATLASRIKSNHIRGNVGSSTFRYTLSSLLVGPLTLKMPDQQKLDPASNSLISSWIAAHLRVSIAPYKHRDGLGEVEEVVIAALDPPLNLRHCQLTDARARITQLRRTLTH